MNVKLNTCLFFSKNFQQNKIKMKRRMKLFTFSPCCPSPTILQASLRSHPELLPAVRATPSCRRELERKGARGQGRRTAACRGLEWTREGRGPGWPCPWTDRGPRSKCRGGRSEEPSWSRTPKRPKKNYFNIWQQKSELSSLNKGKFWQRFMIFNMTVDIILVFPRPRYETGWLKFV